MGTLAQAKNLGGIGSILTLLAIVPYAGTVLAIVGWILVLIAIRYVSDVVQDRSIFNNALIATIVAIVGAAVGGAVIGLNVFHFYSAANVSSLNSTSSFTSPSPALTSLITGVISGLVVIWILAIVASYFLWRSYKTIAVKLNIGTFRTGGLLYLIGSCLDIILVGFILQFVAQILFVVAFFSIPEAPPPGSTVFTPPPPAPSGPTTASVNLAKEA